jgi:F420-dependent oxidoreductase-like protein
MRLGLHVGYWGLGLSQADQLRLVREAEDLGFDSVWTAEAYGSDAATVLGWLAAQTERIKIASGIFQIPARSPAMTAMTAATLDQLSGGRMMLGLGSSGPQVAEGWHGQRFGRQLKRTEEYIAIVRKALGRERVELDGETYTLPLPDGAGKALKLMIAPLQERIPIYLAAIGPKNTELCGQIADGWLPTFAAPEYIASASEQLERGAAKVGRSLDDSFDIAPSVNVCIDSDIDKARDALRPILALYVGGMGSRKRNFYNSLVRSYGFDKAADEVQELYLAGKKQEAAQALPAELIDRVSVCGPKERVYERLDAYRQANVGTLVVTPLASTPEGALQTLRDLSELALARN